MNNEDEKIITMNVNCPHCGTQNEYEIFENIQSDIHPRAKQLLLNDELFECKCKKCKTTSNFLYESAYFNAKYNTLIYFIEEAGVPGICNTIKKMEQNANIDDPYSAINCKKRVVGNPRILREKAVILEQDMDDRVVEMVKVVFTELFKNADKREPKHILFDMHDNNKCFNVYYNNETIVTTFPQNLYEHFKQKFADILIMDKEYIINKKWAMDFMEKYETDDDVTVK